VAEMPTSAHVILMREYGPPRVLTHAEVSLPPLKPGDVRIRSIASAVNHTDLEIRAGNWPIRAADPFPYIPGVEVVGEIVAIGSDVLDFCRGDRVITMMQGLGGVRAERTGGYAEYLDVAAAAAATLPAGVDPYDIAALGLVGITAYEGLRRIGSMPNKRILVTGAAGHINIGPDQLIPRCFTGAIAARLLLYWGRSFICFGVAGDRKFWPGPPPSPQTTFSGKKDCVILRELADAPQAVGSVISEFTSFRRW
jgi:D-arabinose 1-dehydrogenase-like Zn-dependent alcohol dehydrogenase